MKEMNGLPVINEHIKPMCQWCGYDPNTHSEEKKADCLENLSNKTNSTGQSILVEEEDTCPSCGADCYELTKVFTDTGVLMMCDGCGHEWR